MNSIKQTANLQNEKLKKILIKKTNTAIKKNLFKFEYMVNKFNIEFIKNLDKVVANINKELITTGYELSYTYQEKRSSTTGFNLKTLFVFTINVVGDELECGEAHVAVIEEDDDTGTDDIFDDGDIW